MSNPLAGWKILPVGELREMNRISMRENRELEKRVKMAKHEYYEFYKSCTNEVQRRKELERVSINITFARMLYWNMWICKIGLIENKRGYVTL